MDQERDQGSPNQAGVVNLRAQAAKIWQQARLSARRVPLTAWVVLSLFLVGALLMAGYTAFASKDSSLRLKVQHNLRSAQLSVWVDGNLAYSGKLSGAPRKKFGLISEVQGSLSQTLPVASGMHRVQVRVASDEGSVQEDNITGEFGPNAQRTLAVSARRDDVSLNWQGGDTSVAAAAASAPGWFSRYAGSMLITIAGSIISAVTGYMIRELPKHIPAGQQQTPKA